MNIVGVRCTSVVWFSFNRQPDRLRDRTSHPMCRLVCPAVWGIVMERPITSAIRDDPDDWSDCSTLNGNVVYISWHIMTYRLYRHDFDPHTRPDQYRSPHSFKTSEVTDLRWTFDAILAELIFTVDEFRTFHAPARLTDIWCNIRGKSKLEVAETFLP